MTKQEEIINWINKYLTRQFIYDPKELPEDECLEEAKEIIVYLQSQGAVLRVDTPRHPSDRDNSNDFMYESLIKE